MNKSNSMNKSTNAQSSSSKSNNAKSNSDIDCK